MTAAARTALATADWRRRTFALYDAVRATDDPRAAHERWRSGRDALMAAHPASPLLDRDRAGFEGLLVAPYDPQWRFELPILPTAPARFEAATGTDGLVPFERIGVLEVGELHPAA